MFPTMEVCLHCDCLATPVAGPSPSNTHNSIETAGCNLQPLAYWPDQTLQTKERQLSAKNGNSHNTMINDPKQPEQHDLTVHYYYCQECHEYWTLWNDNPDNSDDSTDCLCPTHSK